MSDRQGFLVVCDFLWRCFCLFICVYKQIEDLTMDQKPQLFSLSHTEGLVKWQKLDGYLTLIEQVLNMGYFD